MVTIGVMGPGIDILYAVKKHTHNERNLLINAIYQSAAGGGGGGGGGAVVVVVVGGGGREQTSVGTLKVSQAPGNLHTLHTQHMEVRSLDNEH